MQIAGFIFRIGSYLPSEKACVEAGSQLWVGSAQVSPAERAMDVGDPDSGVPVRLPDAEFRARGVLDDGHATGIHDVKSWRENLASELRGFGGGRIGVVDWRRKSPNAEERSGHDARGAGCTRRQRRVPGV